MHLSLSEERILLKKGHTLHIVKHGEQYFGYLGFWQWEGIKMLIGSTPTDLKFQSKDFIISPARWATATRAFGKTHLFTSLKRKGFKILKYESVDGKPPFRQAEVIIHGRNPFIWQDPNTGIFYLYFQRSRGKIKEIWVSSSSDLENFSDEKILLKMGWTLGAPSMAYFNDAYWLTVETRETLKDGRKGDWFTPIYRGKGPMGPFKRVSVLLDGPCAFQHVFGGQYIVTYSKRDKGWYILSRRAKLE